MVGDRAVDSLAEDVRLSRQDDAASGSALWRPDTGRVNRWLWATLGAGLLIRAALLPITQGGDFAVWDLASRAALHGINIYAHHPAYAGGPYAYFPLFLDLEVPMQWLAEHSGIPFLILGKLPIVAADVVIATLLALQVRRLGHSRRAQALAAALYFLNPLILYNGAFYGRFDSVCIALLLLALHGWQPGRALSWGSAAAYGLSVAAKTFPVFLLPWLFRRDRITALRAVIACGLVVGTISAPYLLTSPGAFVTDLLYSVGKISGSLSWQVVLHGALSTSAQVVVSEALLLIFVVMLFLLTVDDPFVITAVVTLLFIVFSKIVIEQYLSWPIAFLIVLGIGKRSRAGIALLVAVSVVGFLVNPYIHPFGREPAVIDLLLASLIVVGAVSLLRTSRSTGSTPAAIPAVA